MADMDTKLLIDAIVQQTTVLIAQLSTAAGLRAPLAHVADEVFVALARAIEDQGVGRKVVADMFGLALRTYQRKVQRLTESATHRQRTLWEAVLSTLTERGPMTKREVLAAFSRDDERRVYAVLSDLVTSGLLYSSGRGEATLYRATTALERQTLGDTGDADALAIAVWATVFSEPGIRPSDLRARFRVEPDRIARAVAALLENGRLQGGTPGEDAPLSPTSFVIELGAEAGWEAAVFDHFQSVVGAIIKKLELGATRTDKGDVVGGSTFHFSVHAAHPMEQEVTNNLSRVRREMLELYERVTDYNRAHPVPEEERTRVTFYLGQNVLEPPARRERRVDGHNDHESEDR